MTESVSYEEEIKQQNEIIRSLKDSHSILEEENNAFIKQMDNLKNYVQQLREEAKLAIDKAAFVQPNEQNTSTNDSEKELIQARQHIVRLQKELETIKLERASVENTLSFPTTDTCEVDQLEIKELRKHTHHLKNALSEAEDQNHRQKMRLEKLAQIVQEKEKRIHELHQYEFTHKKTSEQKYDLQSVLEKSQKDTLVLQDELATKQHIIQQLENTIQKLTEKSAEGDISSEQFKLYIEESQIKTAQIEKALAAKEALLTQSQESLDEQTTINGHLHQELALLQKQFLATRQTADEKLSANEQLHLELNKIRQKAQQELTHNLKLSKQLTQQNFLTANARKEIEIIKQTLIRGMKEAGEIEVRFKECVQEKVSVLNKFQQLRQQLEKQEALCLDLKEELIQTKLDSQQRLENLSIAHQDAETTLRQAFEEEYKQWQITKQALCDEHSAALDQQAADHQQICDEKDKDLQQLTLMQEAISAEYAEKIQQLNKQLQTATDQHKTQLEDLNIERESLIKQLEVVKEIEQDKELLFRQYEHAQTELSNANQQIDEALQIRAQLEEEIQRLATHCQDKEQECQEAHDQIHRLIMEKTSIQDHLTNTQSEVDDKENQLQMAQQHLAKKVKETALLNDEIENCNQQIHELHQQHVQYQIRAAELQASLDTHLQQENKLQDKLGEVIRGYDFQMQKWEEKYFTMEKRWRETEARKNELECLEDRHQQIQVLFANLGSVLGHSHNTSFMKTSSFSVTKEVPIQTLEEKTQWDEEPSKHVSEEKKPYPNLFDLPNPIEKPKPSLFEQL